MRRKFRIFKTVMPAIPIVAIFLTLIFGINQWRDSPSSLSDKQLVNHVKEYYDLLLNEDYEKLQSFYALKVDRSFDKRNTDFYEIKKRHIKYCQQWKHRKLEVDESSFLINRRENNIYELKYEISYDIKEGLNDNYNHYDLNITMLLNQYGKIFTIYEEKKDK